MENKDLIIIALVIALIYLYYQQRKQNTLTNFTGTSANLAEINEVKKVNQIFADFCRNEIGGQDINEIRTKLNGRQLTEILEENENWETRVDELTRKSNELEAEVISLTNAWKNRVSEKERIITRITQEKADWEKKYKKKAKQLDEEQCENNQLTEKITNLETKITELQTANQQDQQEYHHQLRQINLLFDEKAQDYQVIDFNGLYALLTQIAERERERESKSKPSPNLQSPKKKERAIDQFIRKHDDRKRKQKK